MKRMARRGMAALLLVAAVLALWAFWWEPRRLLVRTATLTLPCAQ